PDRGAAVSSSVVLDTNIKLEHVEVVFNATHPYRGDLEVVLTAPSGTKSVLAAQHFADDGDNYTNWVFSTVRDWGELSGGKWTLTVRDRAAGDVGTFNNWQLRVYGTDVPPVLSGLEATRLTTLEKKPVALTSQLTVADADNQTLAGAQVFVSGNFFAGEDVLTFTPQGAITGAYDGASGILTLSGPGTPAEYQSVLRSVRYTNSSDSPHTLERTIGFRVTDPDGNASNTASRTLAVVPVNDPPTFTVGPDITVAEDAGPQTFAPWGMNISGPEPGQLVSFDVIGNDNPALFSAQPFVRPDGALVFTSAPDANGTATIQVLARDNGGTANGGSDVSPRQTFRINVAPVNDPATARSDDYILAEDRSITVPAPGVLANDRDPEGDALTAVKLTDPPHGNLTFNSDGSFAYMPAPDYSGNDSFTYQVIESGGGLVSPPTTVTLHVVPSNDPPTAVDDTATSNGRPVTINVLANDTDPDGGVLRVGSYTRPALGRVSRQGNSLVYTPLPGATGIDAFSYTAVDSAGVAATATVTVNVTDTVAPEIQSVHVRYGTGVADLAALGRSVLSWANVARFDFVFSEGVTVDPGALTLTGELGGDVALNFNFNPATRTATWTSPTALAIDRYTLRLSAGGAVDAWGNPLGGDWAKAFAVLPGDFDGNGFVDNADLTGIGKSFSRPGRPVNRWADVNGDGVVDAADLNAASQNQGKRI
ncbi:MAG: tandem-95 repeat protein, partial [Zavarzinella sp.]|nr:tandem-95 repeat protein [Zavarzinella sp.]